jgi:hypothetical protein
VRSRARSPATTRVARRRDPLWHGRCVVELSSGLQASLRAMTHLVLTAFVPRLDKSEPAVWMALDGEHRAAFEAELRAVLAEVADTFDVDRLAQVVRRGWPRAVVDAHRDPIVEHIGQRLIDGDQSVLTKTAAELRAEMVSRANALGGDLCLLRGGTS